MSRWTLLAAAVPVAVCAVLAGVRDWVGPGDAALVVVLVVVGAAALGSLLDGVVAALVGTLAFDVFLTVPYGSVTIASRDDVQTAVLLVTVGLIVSGLAERGRRQAQDAARERGHLEGLLGATAMAAEGTTPADAVVDLVCRQVIEVLGVETCVLRPGSPTGTPRLERDGTLTRDGHRLDVARSGLPVLDVVELAVVHGREQLGCLVLSSPTRVARPTRQQLRVAVALADQAGAVLADQARQRG